MNTELPLADPVRVEMAERIFSGYKTMSPEEWAARYSHTMGCSSFDQYRYENKELHNWIQRLHAILISPKEDISIYRKKYLSEQKIKSIEHELNKARDRPHRLNPTNPPTELQSRRTERQRPCRRREKCLTVSTGLRRAHRPRACVFSGLRARQI